MSAVADAHLAALAQNGNGTNGSPIQPSEFPAELPAYLIHVKAELRADGQVVASGGDFVLGSTLVGASGMYAPSTAAWLDSDHAVHAGEYHALAIDGQGVAASELDRLKIALGQTQAALDAGQYGDLDRDAVTGGLLHQMALGYFALADANARIYQRASDAVEVRLPSHVRAVAKVEPQYAYGIVTKARFPGVVLDIDRYERAAVDKHNGALTAYNRQGMERASAYAHLVLEKILVDAQHPGQGISAVKALAAANAQGQTTRLVTQANAATLVPLLAIDAASRTEIADAAAAGKRVLAADGTLVADAWTGSGYIVEDSQSGQGDYRLSGTGHGALYPVGGMAWLALGSSAQTAASVSHALNNGIQFDGQAAAVLGGMDNTRWQYFPAQTEVMNGLFLGHLNALQATGACELLATAITSSLSASSGIDTIGGGNQPPVIQSAPVTQATAGRPYGYPLQATDPDGDPLTYQVITGPAGLSVDATGLVTWTSPVEGAWSVTLRVDDGRAYVEQSYLLAVGQGSLSLDLTLVVNPKVANAGDPVTVGLVTNGGEAPVTLNLTVDGQAVALDANGQAQLTAAAGIHRLVATASDSQGTVTREDVYSTRDAADTTAPVAQITAPLDDAEITAPVDIVGTATDANLAYYQLALRPAGGAPDAWTEIGRGYAGVSNAKLGRLDPTVLANGLYDLALIVVDGNGQQTSTLVTVEVTRDLKIGQFSVSFLDLDIEAAGIPIRVTRTYDTRHKGDKLDFGYGWSVDYQSVQLRKNMTLGLQWNVVQQQFSLCLRPAGQRKVSITLPDGKVERFAAANATECAFAQVPPVDIRFTALPGTTSTLEAINLPSLVAQGGQLYDMDNFGPWNPTEFKLTTEDGTIYYLKEGVGITQVKDPWRNTLTYGANGISHSNGQGVAFTRDAQGRITAVTDPTGKTIRYVYDANGDLTQVTDRLNQTSRYQYNREHGLTAYTDPSGTTAARQIYDDQGRLIATIDADGQRTEIGHDLATNTETVKNRRGYATTYTYDGQGNVTQVTDALGHTTRYAYDALGNETQVTDPLGNVTTRTYNASTGKTLSETDPLGHATAYGYDAIQKTQLKQVTDPKGNVTGYRYDGTAPTGIDEPLGRSTTLGYDGKGDLTALNVAGQGTAYGYDAKGNRTTETDAAGTVTTYSYDGNNREISRTWQRTNAQGQKENLTVSRKYDAEGRVVEETDALGGITRTSWNSAGKPTQVTDPQGRITAYAYDTQARLTKTTYPDGTWEGTEYDANGNETATTDRAGRTTRYAYDALDRRVKTTWPDGTIETTEYDAAGRVIATVDGNGQRTANAYDGAGRLTETTDPQGGKTTYAYDANGNRTQTTDPLGRVTAYTYDALNRLIQTTYPDGTAHSVVYRPDGRKHSETDPAGKTVSYGYDALGRLNQVTESLASGQVLTTYQYDEAGNKTRQTDAEGRVTTWAYDQGNRVTKRTLPNGEAETFQYDLAGNLTAHTDFQGRTTQYGYDSGNRRTLTLYPDGSKLVVAYTPDGQIASRTDSTGTTAWRYDAQGRPVQQTNPDGRTLAWSYDGNGNVIERSSPQGTTRYAYDGNNRLIRVTDPEGGITSYAWNAANQATRIQYPNGTETRNEYDRNGRLIQTAHLKGMQVIDATRYTLAADGRRTRVETFDGQSVATDTNGQLTLINPAGTKDYGYDALNRLTQETVTGRSQNYAVEYAYDQVGNRTKKTESRDGATTVTDYAYDGNDRLISETTGQTVTTYTWDGNGNLAKRQTPSETTLYGWDAENRLVEVKRGTDAASATPVARYAYDADGNRVRKIETTPAGDVVTDYLIDTTFPYAQAVEETTTQNGQTESVHYVWGAQLIKQMRGGQGTYYHADGLGSVKALTDESGTATDAYEYGAFGEALGHSGATANAYRYTGEYYDETASLQYNRARWYDPSVGRFSSHDRWPGRSVKPASLHKYLYADVEPVCNTDPTGAMTLVGMNISLSVLGTLATTSVRVVANRLAGKAFESYVEQTLIRFTQQYGGEVLKQVYLTGPGGARFADFIVKMGNKLVVIEAKTSMPMGGSALARLGGQLKTYVNPSNLQKLGGGQVVETIVVSMESVAQLEATFAAVEGSLASGTLSGVLQGSNMLMTALRGILLGF